MFDSEIPSGQERIIDMLRVVGRIGSAVLDTLLPSKSAQACTDCFCENNAAKTKHRCCKFCPSGKVCGTWQSGKCNSSSCPTFC